MKLEDKQRAIVLRKKGYSITTIATMVGVSKSSVSLWVRDVGLSKTALEAVKQRSHTSAVIEKRRLTRITNEKKARDAIVASAKLHLTPLTKQELFLVGVALYWGEGSKKKRGMVEFTNSDPLMIRLMKRFLVEVCDVPQSKFRGHVYLHAHLAPSKAEVYWSGISEIPRSQFHKTSIQKNTRRLQKDTLPFGTFAIVVCDTRLKLLMNGWIQGLGERS